LVISVKDFVLSTFHQHKQSTRRHMLGPQGSSFPGEKLDLFRLLCRWHNLSIADLHFKRKVIHCFSWIFSDDITWKEIDQLISWQAGSSVIIAALFIILWQ